MNIKHFNAALLLGWLLVLVGGCLINPGAGLIVGGLLLIVLVIGAAISAGLYDPAAARKEPD